MKIYTPHSIKSQIEGPLGYVMIKLQSVETERLRSWVRDQWLYRILLLSPAHVKEFAAIEMNRYHELAPLIDHKTAWPRTTRILTPTVAAEIRTMPFMKNLESEFGDFLISDEEGVGWEEIHWRIVRPDAPDIGPLHADSWHWKAGHGTMPEGRERVKVWIALYSESGRNGLRIVPGSHRRDNFRYHVTERDGILKPQIDENEADLNIELLPTEPGDIVIFHDDLLHGGAENRGTTTRISLEFTMLVKK